MLFSNMIKPLLVWVLILPVIASSVSALTFGKFTYEVLNGTEIEITGYPTTEVGEVTIPAEIDNKPVVLIEFHAFRDCVGLTRVIIPDSVEFIDIWAFQGCSSLSEISVGAGNPSLASVDGVLFNKNQTNLINCPEGKAGAFAIPGTVISIGWSAFDGCSKLTSVTIPSSVGSIGNTAFRDCSDLTSLTIPNSVTSIGWSAFSGCSDLVNVTLPNNIASISSGMFSSCTSLNTINIPNSVTDIGNFAFSDCGDLASITIPNGVTSIGNRAFSYTRIVSVTLPGGLTSIGEEAFGSTQLTSVMIPDNVTSIGDRAFARCDILTAIIVGPGNTHYLSLDGVLFNKNQTTLIQYPGGKTGGYSIPEGVTSIGDSAFMGNLLTSIYIPNSVSSIGPQAFSRSRNAHLNTVTIPKNVTSIGDGAFALNSSLVTTYFAGNAPATFGVNVFNGVSASHKIFYRNDATGFASPTWNGYATVEIKFGYVVLGDATIEITSYPTTETGPVFIPFSIEQKPVTSIGSNAFSGCRDITSITIPDGLSHIALGAFDDCESLLFFSASGGNAHYLTPDGVLLNRNQTTLIRYPLAKTGGYMIPNSVTSLSDEAFKNCKNLSNVTIPNGVIAIGNRAFYGCSHLTQAYFAGDAPASFGTQVFDGVAANHRIYYTSAATGFTSPT